VTTFRPATPADAEPLARAVVEGFETYRGFARSDWEPPPLGTELEHLRVVLADDDTWALIAEVDGRLVGQVSFLPAAGAGLARGLHAAVVAAARERGFAQMRLFTPALHGRARRFYEREGWAQLGEEFDEPGLGMAIVEYRYALS
jgi:GNAT superfamily N-acetyltransferase